MLVIGLFGFAVYLTVEYLKPRISRQVLRLVYRENELKGFSMEPLSYFISVLSLLYLSFYVDEKLCYGAVAVLAAGDGFAGLVGRRFGKHRFPFNRNKSWEGSISGFAAGSIAGFYYSGQIALVGSGFGMLAGAVSRNDNIAVPYAALTSMLLLRSASLL
jgi:dolichol kinase